MAGVFQKAAEDLAWTIEMDDSTGLPSSCSGFPSRHGEALSLMIVSLTSAVVLAEARSLGKACSHSQVVEEFDQI